MFADLDEPFTPEELAVIETAITEQRFQEAADYLSGWLRNLTQEERSAVRFSKRLILIMNRPTFGHFILNEWTAKEEKSA